MARTVLVVDDEFSIVETLVEILSWEGLDARTASNGRAGLKLLREGRIDLVVVDFMMPVMDGLQMVQEMRADPSLAKLPVLMMSAAPMVLAQHTPVWDAFLRKPFGADEFIDAVKKLLP